MKMVRLWTIISLVILLAGCKNRFETYEPYSAYDERMAAAQESQRYADGQEYSGRDYYGPEYSDRDDYRSGNYYQERSAPVRRAKPIAQSSSSGSSSSPEVPFDSSRGAKHAANIGAMENND